VKVGSVFITKDHETMIVIESIDRDVVIFRYITAHAQHRVGTTDWAYTLNLIDADAFWYQIA
jgi:hypothetical protein